MGLRQHHFSPTSAVGSMFPSPLGAATVAAVAASLLLTRSTSSRATAGAYRLSPEPELTSAAPPARVDLAPSESTAAAVLEIRRISGLTWDELADLFEVSRRSVHHWASGKQLSAEHEQSLRGVLTAMRYLDRGEAAATRALLLADNAVGASIFELLKEGFCDEAVALGSPGIRASRAPRPLSRDAIEARRVPHPALLLGAEQDRPAVPSRPRVARAARVEKS